LDDFGVQVQKSYSKVYKSNIFYLFLSKLHCVLSCSIYKAFDVFFFYFRSGFINLRIIFEADEPPTGPHKWTITYTTSKEA